MKEEADKQMTGDVAAKLVCSGFRIRVENKNGNGRFVVAVLGSAANNLNVESLREMTGVAECLPGNEYYNENCHYFKDPYGFFSWGF